MAAKRHRIAVIPGDGLGQAGEVERARQLGPHRASEHGDQATGPGGRIAYVTGRWWSANWRWML